MKLIDNEIWMTWQEVYESYHHDLKWWQMLLRYPQHWLCYKFFGHSHVLALTTAQMERLMGGPPRDGIFDLPTDNAWPSRPAPQRPVRQHAYTDEEIEQMLKQPPPTFMRGSNWNQRTQDDVANIPMTEKSIGRTGPPPIPGKAGPAPWSDK